MSVSMACDCTLRTSRRPLNKNNDTSSINCAYFHVIAYLGNSQFHYVKEIPVRWYKLGFNQNQTRTEFENHVCASPLPLFSDRGFNFSGSELDLLKELSNEVDRLRF